MRALEQILALFVAAVILAAAARRVGAPYPLFLAIGGALLAFVPGMPAFTVPPELVMLNDASALLIYWVAVGPVAAGGFSIASVAPTFLFAVGGSLIASSRRSSRMKRTPPPTSTPRTPRAT